MHKLINGFIRRFHNIHKAFMRCDHEIFPAVAVDKRRPLYIEMLLVRRKRNGSENPCARTNGHIQDLLAAVINDPAVICF